VQQYTFRAGQVFWLPDQSTSLRLPILSGQWHGRGFRPRLQQRDCGGFSPRFPWPCTIHRQEFRLVHLLSFNVHDSPEYSGPGASFQRGNVAKIRT